MAYTRYDSPLGALLLTGDDGGLTGLHFPESELGSDAAPDRCGPRAAEPFAEVMRQLDEYFDRRRTFFDLRLAPAGTPFQRRVWQALTEIPYGETISYGELARRIGRPDLARAVGTANGQNPIAVIVPCHRVIGANGKLVGYGGGLDNKRRLLELESGVLPLV